METLKQYWAASGPERVGFVMTDGGITEVLNSSPDPMLGFEVSPETMLEMEGRVQGTWHTHPRTSNNLSAEDMTAFKNWPDLRHFIVAAEGVAEYEVRQNGAVVRID